MDRIIEQVIVPKNQVLDNDILAEYRKEIRAAHMTFQLVPIDDNFQKLAEKSIHMWKDHFIGVMSRTETTFPVYLWCQYIPQAE